MPKESNNNSNNDDDRLNMGFLQLGDLNMFQKLNTTGNLDHLATQRINYSFVINE